MNKEGKKIGIALGAGSARGLSHIGVLSVLEKHGIRPDFVAGTSIGAVVGALYCSGIGPEVMKRIAITTEWQELLDFTIPKRGIIAGNKVEQQIQALTDNKKFSDLLIPLRVVATDIKNANKVVFSEGNVAKAVRASISIPGVFTPVQIDNHELVDGALVDPIPIEDLRVMGADIIIAVDISMQLDEVHIRGSRVKERSTFFDYMKGRFIKSQVNFFKEFVMETKRFRLPHFIKKYIVRVIDRFFNPIRIYRFLMRRKMPQIVDVAIRSMLIISSQVYKEKLKYGNVDIIIRPDIKEDMITGFDHAPQLIDSGEKATEAMMPEIMRVLGTASS